MEQNNYISTVTIISRKLVSRYGSGTKEYIDCACTSDDLDNGYPKDPTFPLKTNLANGSSMIVTDTKKVMIFDEKNSAFVEW